MKPLRRITTPRSGPMRSIELTHICDQFIRHRYHGGSKNNRKGGKQR